MMCAELEVLVPMLEGGAGDDDHGAGGGPAGAWAGVSGMDPSAPNRFGLLHLAGGGASGASPSASLPHAKCTREFVCELLFCTDV